MNSSSARTIPALVALSAIAIALAACGSGHDGTQSPGAASQGKTAIGLGNAILLTNDTTGARPRKGALDRLADGLPAGAAPGERTRGGLIAGEPDIGILDRLPPPAGLGAAKRVCAAASASPSNRNMGRIVRSILCLLNAERVSRGLRALRSNRKLARAAIGHSRHMVTRRYFAHNGSDGNPVSRIKRAGYIPRSGFWTIGENLAYGTGTQARPARIVAAWMRSPAHKANILTRGFKEIGIGIVAKPAMGGGRGATFTTTFGAIRRR